MAGKDFDSQDIRSDMEGKRVASPYFATSMEPTVEEMLKRVAVEKNPTPIEAVAPGEPENEIDVKNPPDFEALNRAFPLLPRLRRSKRQAGYDPDFVEPKKLKASSYSMNMLDPDFSSGDDSGDEDFEIVALPKASIKKCETSQAPATTEEGNNSENEESLAEFLSQLKTAKKKTSVVEMTPAEEEPDSETLEEFADNCSNASGSSSSTSSSDSVNTTSNEVNGGSDEEIAGSKQDVDRMLLTSQETSTWRITI